MYRVECDCELDGGCLFGPPVRRVTEGPELDRSFLTTAIVPTTVFMTAYGALLVNSILASASPYGAGNPGMTGARIAHQDRRLGDAREHRWST